VRIETGSWTGVTVRINGSPADAQTSRDAVELLLGDARDVHVIVDQTMDLPVSQGFGMSAAGALSASLALGQILGRPRLEAVWAAHCAEVNQRSGLGDVVGAAVGGFEMREEPGVEPHGRIVPFKTGEPTDDVILAVVDEAILTKTILRDPARRQQIKQQGAAALKSFRTAPGLRSFADVSRKFSLDTRLASDRIARIYNELERMALVSQCMLGGSVFAFGRSADVRQRLSRYGAVFQTKVDFEGARVLTT
jgi:pantoate kinase